TGLRNPGASCFFIYGAAFVGQLGPPSRGVRWLFAIVVIAGIESWVAGLSPMFWVPAIVISLIIGGTNIHFAKVDRQNRELLRANEEAERLARVAERERIARDLHDLLGHTLSVIVL